MSKVYWNTPETLGARVYWGASIGLTTLASLGGTAALHTGEEHQWHQGLALSSETLSSETLQKAAGEPYPGIETVTVADEQPVKIQKELEFGQAKGVYARNYDEDPAAREVDKPAGDRIREVIEELKQDGWTDFHLTVQGRASAEDSLNKSDAGLSSESRDNVDLANQRSNSFISYLMNEGNLPEEVRIEPVAAVEQSLDEEQLGVLNDLSTQFGYDNVSDMVDTWNQNPETVPPAVNATLTSILGNYRGVVAMITAEKDGGMNGFPATKEQAVCYVPVAEQTTEYVRSVESELPIPKFVIVPIPVVLPLIRRRKNQTAGLTPKEYAAATRTIRKTGYAHSIASASRARMNAPYSRGSGGAGLSPFDSLFTLGSGGNGGIQEQPPRATNLDINGISEDDDFDQVYEVSLGVIDGIGEEAAAPQAPTEEVTPERRRWNIKGVAIIGLAIAAGAGFLTLAAQCTPEEKPAEPTTAAASGSSEQSSKPACAPGVPQRPQVVRTLPTRYVNRG